MAQFQYSAVSKSGQKVKGVIEAFNELDAANRIRQTCDVIQKITPLDESKKNPLNFDLGANKLNNKAFTVMCNQFAIILRSGVPLARAVHLIGDKTTDKPLKRLLKLVAEDVEGGRSLTTSFEEHGSKILPVTFLETLRAGEESGNIAKSFETMAAHFDKQTKIKAKVKSAMAYPLFVLVIAVVVVAVVMVFVIPKLTPIFTENGGEIPFMMNSLVVVSNFFRKYIFVIVAIIAAIVIGFKLYGKTHRGHINLSKRKLGLPVLGNIEYLTAASEFANSMAAMMGAGLPILGNIEYLTAASEFANSMAAMMGAGLPIPRALSITAKTMSNYYLSTENGKLSGELESGRALGSAMREQNVMPEILVDMVGVGEETGELEGTMDTVAQFYDNELDEATKAALAKLEPAMLIFIAVFAGYIVIAIYTGIFSMYGTMS